MNSSPSDKKNLDQIMRDIDDLLQEVDAGFAELFSDKTVNDLRRWLRRSSSEPYRNTECLLAVAERNGLPELCCAWLANNGISVFSTEADGVRGREALMQWRSELRKRRGVGDLCVFIRGLNLLTVAEQQDFWASWVNTLSPTTRERFGYSCVPFTEEFDHITKADIWVKFSDRTVVFIDHA